MNSSLDNSSTSTLINNNSSDSSSFNNSNNNNDNSTNSTSAENSTIVAVAVTKEGLPIFLNIPAPLTPDPTALSKNVTPPLSNFNPITEGANLAMPKSGCDAGCVASFVLASLVLSCLLVALLLGVMKRMRKPSASVTQYSSSDRKTSKAGISRRPESSFIIDDDIRKTLVVRVYPHDSSLFTGGGGGGGVGEKSQGGVSSKKQSSSTISSIFSPPLEPPTAAGAGAGAGKYRDSLKRYVPEREEVNYSGSSRAGTSSGGGGSGGGEGVSSASALSKKQKHLSENRMDSPISPTSSSSRIPSIPPVPPRIATVKSNLPVLAPNPQPILPLDRLNEQSDSDYDSSSDEESGRVVGANGGAVPGVRVIDQVKQQQQHHHHHHPVSWGEQGPYYEHTSQYVGVGGEEFKQFREEGEDEEEEEDDKGSFFDAVQYERSPHASAVASPPLKASTSTSTSTSKHPQF